MSVTDFISAAIEEKPVAALKAFSDAIQPKVDAAIAAKYDEVAQTVFTGTSAQLEQELEPELSSDTEFETEMEDTQDE